MIAEDIRRTTACLLLSQHIYWFIYRAGMVTYFILYKVIGGREDAKYFVFNL